MGWSGSGRGTLCAERNSDIAPFWSKEQPNGMLPEHRIHRAAETRSKRILGERCSSVPSPRYDYITAMANSKRVEIMGGVLGQVGRSAGACLAPDKHSFVPGVFLV